MVVERGPNYKNWIIAAKQKLKERERLLLQKRQQTCDKIFISAIHTFVAESARADLLHNDADVERLQTVMIAIYNRELQRKLIDTHSRMISRCMRLIDAVWTKLKGVCKDKPNVSGNCHSNVLDILN